MGDPARFAKGKQFRSFSGLTPKASETGNTDRKGQAMSKAGSSLLRTTLIRAADHARRHDPQLARIYYIQMVERGKNHLGALCVVAANLAERAWTVMNRNTPYIVCDIDGTPVTNRAGQSDHRRLLDRSRRGPSPPTQHQNCPEGEGPPGSLHETTEATRQRRGHTGRPPPTNIINPTLASNQDPRRKSRLTPRSK